eukprot:5297109-Pyramimonas_sp.AAC.1
MYVRSLGFEGVSFSDAKLVSSSVARGFSGIAMWPRYWHGSCISGIAYLRHIIQISSCCNGGIVIPACKRARSTRRCYDDVNRPLTECGCGQVGA